MREGFFHQGAALRQKPGTDESRGEEAVKDIRRATRKQYSAEDKVWIVLDGQKGKESIAYIAQHMSTLV